jgi:hypothetical protein
MYISTVRSALAGSGAGDGSSFLSHAVISRSDIKNIMILFIIVNFLRKDSYFWA